MLKPFSSINKLLSEHVIYVHPLFLWLARHPLSPLPLSSNPSFSLPFRRSSYSVASLVLSSCVVQSSIRRGSLEKVSELVCWICLVGARE